MQSPNKRWYAPDTDETLKAKDFRDSLNRDTTEFIEENKHLKPDRYQEFEIRVEGLSSMGGSQNIDFPPTVPTKLVPSKQELQIEKKSNRESVETRRSQRWKNQYKKKKKGVLTVEEFQDLIMCSEKHHGRRNTLLQEMIDKKPMFTDGVFTYDFRDEEKFHIIEQVSTAYILPPLSTLCIKFFPSNDKLMKRFLYKSLNKLDSLYINNQFKSDSGSLNIKNYLEPLDEAINHVKTKVVICDSVLTSNDFSELMTSSAHVKIFSLLDCKLELSEPLVFAEYLDFDVEFINFGECSRADGKNLTQKDFENVFKAIKACDMQNTLNIIDVTN